MIRFSAKQIEILSIIRKGNTDGSLVSVYDILDKLSYEAPRDSVMHCIRRLVEAGYVERKHLEKRGKSTVKVYCITTKALPVPTNSL